MKNVSPEENICEFIEKLDYQVLPESVVDSSKKLLLDLIGVMCLSYTYESTEAIFRSTRRLAGDVGNGVIVGSSVKLPYQYAALLNGALAHTSEFDDTNALGHSHPGAVIIPAVFAAAQMKEKVDGKHFITGIVAGYEIMCRVGASLGKTVHKRGFHVTPICGIFGAVAAISKILNLDAQTIHHAMGLAGSLVSGSHQFSENGAWNKRLHPGFMAHHAFLSVLFASEGIIGASQPLTGERGFLKGHTDDPMLEKVDHNLGEFWYTDKTAIKPYPACRLTHAAIDLILDFQKNYSIPSEEIESISIDISPRAFYAVGERVERRLNPLNMVDAQFSIYFQVAVALLFGEANVESYNRIGDNRIFSLTKKMTVNQIETFEKQETHIAISTKKNTYHLKTKIAKGEPQNPLQWEEILSKYYSLSSRLGNVQQKRIVDLIMKFEQIDDLHGFFDALSIQTMASTSINS